MKPGVPGRVTIDGCDLATESWGDGPPLVGLHGGMGIDSASLHGPGILGLAEGRRVILFDQRGHGRSGRSAPSDYTHDRWVDDLKGLATALGLGRFSLLGHSYGGFLALTFALRHPELLESLILVGTSAGPVAVAPPPIADDSALREFFRGQWPHFFPGPEKHWDVFDRLTFSSGPFEAAFLRELPRYDVRDRVPGLAPPTLLVVGSDDYYRRDMEWLAETAPRAELRVIPGSGHLPFLDQPEAFRSAVDDFLRRQPDPRPAP